MDVCENSSWHGIAGTGVAIDISRLEALRHLEQNLSETEYIEFIGEVRKQRGPCLLSDLLRNVLEWRGDDSMGECCEILYASQTVAETIVASRPGTTTKDANDNEDNDVNDFSSCAARWTGRPYLSYANADLFPNPEYYAYDPYWTQPRKQKQLSRHVNKKFKNKHKKRTFPARKTATNKKIQKNKKNHYQNKSKSKQARQHKSETRGCRTEKYSYSQLYEAYCYSDSVFDSDDEAYMYSEDDDGINVIETVAADNNDNINRLQCDIEHIVEGKHIVYDRVRKQSMVHIPRMQTTMAGHLSWDRFGRSGSVIIDDMDTDRVSYWNKSITFDRNDTAVCSLCRCKQESEIRCCEYLKDGDRVIFEVILYPLDTFMCMQVNMINDRIVWERDINIRATNIRPPQMQEMENAKLVCAAYVNHFSNRWGMAYIPCDIQYVVAAIYLNITSLPNGCWGEQKKGCFSVDPQSCLTAL